MVDNGGRRARRRHGRRRPRSAGGDGGVPGDSGRTWARRLRGGRRGEDAATRRRCSWTAAPAPPQGGAGGHGTRPASTSTSRLRHGGGSGPPQRRHPRPAATALSPHARARHARARRSVMTERALPVMTERIASGGAASLTAALPREGVHGRRRTPKHRREGHGQRRQHLETVRDGGSLLPLSLGHARHAAPRPIRYRRAGVRCAPMRVVAHRHSRAVGLRR